MKSKVFTIIIHFIQNRSMLFLACCAWFICILLIFPFCPDFPLSPVFPLSPFFTPSPVFAAIDKSGVSPSVLSLPSGPGSIEGLGASFEPQLNTGTATYSAKITVPPGLCGHQPELALIYNSGFGNSPFGLGWQLDIPCIERQTDKGIPLYNYQDTFIFQGEELVPLPDQVYGKVYRLKNESSFSRIVQMGNSWQVTDLSGVTYRFGLYPDGATPGRISRLGNGSTSFSQTFRWCLDEAIDTNGHKIEYFYTSFSDSPGQLYVSSIRYNQHGSSYHEIAFDYEPRQDPYTDYRSGFKISTARRCSQIRVSSCGQLIRRYVLGYQNDPDDPIYRTISQSSLGIQGAQGTQITQGNQGTQGISLQFSIIYQITQFDSRPSGEASYLPPLRFAYTPFDPNQAQLVSMANPAAYSLALTNTQIADLDGDALPDIIYTPSSSSVSNGQHLYHLNCGNNSFSEEKAFKHNPFVTLEDPGVQLADFDGDGLCDLIQKAGGESGLFYCFPNLNGFDRTSEADFAWGDEISYAQPYPPVEDAHLRMIDLNFDKKTDFMKVTQAGIQYYFNMGKGWTKSDFYLFGDSLLADMKSGEVQFVNGDGEKNPFVHVADMNGDRLLDLVNFILMGNQLEISYWPNMGWGRWDYRDRFEQSIFLPVVEAEDILLFDVNGDGLSDLVVVDNEKLFFWINLGTSFSQKYSVSATPCYIRGKTILRQSDMNGNGTTDLVWENWDNPKESRLQYFDFVGRIKPYLLSLIDNGLGKQTLIEYTTSTRYYVEAKEQKNPWKMKVPFPLPLVSRITVSCGLDLDGDEHHTPDQSVTDMVYRDGFYDSQEKEFRGFSFVKKIQWGDETFPTQVSRYCFHTGAPDHIDNDGDGATDENSTEGEWEDEPLKGKILWTESCGLNQDQDGTKADDAHVYERTVNTWKIKVIHSPSSGNPLFPLSYTLNQKSIVFAYLEETKKEIIEANGSLNLADSERYPRRSLKLSRSAYEYDWLGHQIKECVFGEDQPESSADDEIFTLTDYALNLTDWIIDRPYRIRIMDEEGNIISEKRYYYDGEDFVGLALGEIGKMGRLKREEIVITADADLPPLEETCNLPGDPRLPAGFSINKARNSYDQYGNVIAILDERGNRRDIIYDETFHTFPVQEIIHLEACQIANSYDKVEAASIRLNKRQDGTSTIFSDRLPGEDKSPLIASATYDYGFGVMTTATDFNGYTTLYTYDSFGRLTAIIKPHDSLRYPTQQFSYKAADPLRWCFYEYDATGRLMINYSATNRIACSVKTCSREKSGEPGTFDTISYTDGLGRKLAIIEEGDQQGQFAVKEAITYSASGKVEETFLPYLADTDQYEIPSSLYPKTTHLYDPLGRQIKTITPPDAENKTHSTHIVYLPLEKHTYDEEDTDPSSFHYATPTISMTDGLERLVELQEINSDLHISPFVTRYKWDLLKNLVEVKDNQNNVKTFRYDCLGRKIFMNDPDRGRIYYSYDEAGNPITIKDNKGQITHLSYDAANRKLTENFLGDTNRIEVIYHYDEPSFEHQDAANLKGRLAYVEDLSGGAYFSYDERGNRVWIMKKIVVDGEKKEYRTSMSYDALDRVSAYTYPDGKSISYLYTGRSLLEAIPQFVNEITYTAAGAIHSIIYANGVESAYTYDPRQRLVHLVTAKAKGVTSSNGDAPVQDLSYQFDGVSNLIRILDGCLHEDVKALATQEFSYDDLYRLNQVQSPGYGKILYRYDSIGNMIYQSSPEVGMAGHIDDALINLGEITHGAEAGAQNRSGRAPQDPPGSHALTKTASGLTYAYDDNGNMVLANGDEYTFNHADHLVHVKKANLETTYTYDYAGQRVIKKTIEIKGKSSLPTNTASAQTTLYINPSYEILDGKAICYLFAGDRRIAQWEGETQRERQSQVIHLLPGWNLISIYPEPDDPSVAALFSSIAGKYQEVWAYDSQKEEYHSYIPGRVGEDNDFVSIEPLQGYLILMNEDAHLTVIGTFCRREIILYPGWNLIGCPGDEPKEISSFFSSLKGKYQAIWGYETQGNMWKKYLPQTDTPSFLNDLTCLKPGCGYWLDVTDECTLSFDTWQDGEVFFYHTDHLGSSNRVTDREGKVVEATEFYPFGLARFEKAEEFQSRYKFTGKERDTESGLDYFGARYYLPVVGRFISVDPVEGDVGDPQSFHKYAYCRNNPLKYIDPTGELFDPITWGFIGAGLFVAGDYLLQWNKSDKSLWSYYKSGDYSIQREAIAAGLGAGTFAAGYYAISYAFPIILNTFTGASSLQELQHNIEIFESETAQHVQRMIEYGKGLGYDWSQHDLTGFFSKCNSLMKAVMSNPDKLTKFQRMLINLHSWTQTHHSPLSGGSEYYLDLISRCYYPSEVMGRAGMSMSKITGIASSQGADPAQFEYWYNWFINFISSNQGVADTTMKALGTK